MARPIKVLSRSIFCRISGQSFLSSVHIMVLPHFLIPVSWFSSFANLSIDLLNYTKGPFFHSEGTNSGGSIVFAPSTLYLTFVRTTKRLVASCAHVAHSLGALLTSLIYLIAVIVALISRMMLAANSIAPIGLMITKRKLNLQ